MVVMSMNVWLLLPLICAATAHGDIHIRECPTNEGLYFATTTDCSMFYRCQQQFLSLGMCLPSHRFDIHTLTCRQLNEVDCNPEYSSLWRPVYGTSSLRRLTEGNLISSDISVKAKVISSEEEILGKILVPGVRNSRKTLAVWEKHEFGKTTLVNSRHVMPLRNTLNMGGIKRIVKDWIFPQAKKEYLSDLKSQAIVINGIEATTILKNRQSDGATEVGLPSTDMFGSKLDLGESELRTEISKSQDNPGDRKWIPGITGGISVYAGTPSAFPGGMPGFPGVIPGYPGVIPGYPGVIPGFPGGIYGFPGGIPGFQGGIAGFTGEIPGYTGELPGYTGELPGFPGEIPGYPEVIPGFPGGLPGYPGSIPGFPGGMPGFPGGLPGYPGSIPGLPGIPGITGGIPGIAGGYPGFTGGIPEFAAGIQRDTGIPKITEGEAKATEWKPVSSN